MDERSHLQILWSKDSNIACVAERCKICGSKWWTSFEAGRLGGVRTPLLFDNFEDQFVRPRQLCNKCKVIDEEFLMIAGEE